MAFNKDRVAYLLALPKTKEVVEELIQANHGLVYVQLRKFGLVNDDDATSHGVEALYNAITSYDVHNRSSFSNYATICIFNRLGDYVRSLKTIANTNTVSYDTLVGENDTPFSMFIKSKDTAYGKILQEVGTNPMHLRILNAWIDSDFTVTHLALALSLDCSQSYVTQAINAFRRNLKNELED